MGLNTSRGSGFVPQNHSWDLFYHVGVWYHLRNWNGVFRGETQPGLRPNVRARVGDMTILSNRQEFGAHAGPLLKPSDSPLTRAGKPQDGEKLHVLVIQNEYSTAGGKILGKLHLSMLEACLSISVPEGRNNIS